MSLGRPGRETNAEVEYIDGFQFVSFERIEEIHKYLKQTAVHCRRQPAPPQLSRENAKPPKARAKTSKSSSSAKSNASRSASSATPKASKAKPGGDKKVPVWLKHKRRLRKSDKRVILDKFHGFLFASAFTLDDFDVHKEELANEVSSAAPGAKRKASPTMQATVLGSSGEKRHKRSTKELDGGNLVTSNLLSGTARPAGEKLANDAGKKFAKDAGISDAIPASLGMSDLDRLMTFTSSIVPPINDALLSMVDQASEPFHTGQYVAETSKDQKQKIKDRKKQYPHMQIDEAYNRTISSPSGSESSVITISDEGPDQENIILDVINVDDELSSAQFIQDSIKMVNDNQPGDMPKDKDKAKRKKCRICCIYPSKIVEAKKISPLFGSFFPSYTVSCVSTCKQHPPGDIIVMPSTSKPGYVDTCIQTNAPDIRMNLDFAHRFPHRTIAIKTHCSRMLTQPTPRTKRAKFFNKSEHHRSSEQKRREQMHDQFTDLRKIITTSQAIPDNERASKQWILEHAMMIIASLEAESAVLVALKKTVAAKNERLKSKWRELSGREFDTNVHRCYVPSQSSGETKLINLYKQYRKNVHERKSSNKTNGVEFNQSAVTTQPIEPSVTTSKNQSQAMVEVSLVRQSSGADTGKQPGGEMVTDAPKQMKLKEAVSGNSTSNVNHPSQAMVTSNPTKASSMKMLNAASTVLPGRPNEAECRNPASQVMVTSNPSQVTYLDKPSHDACTIMERTSEAVIFTKPNQASSAVSANPEQPSTINNPTRKVANNSSQSTSSGMPNQPCIPIVPVSSQLPIPVKLSSHPRAVRNPDPTISVSMPSQAATTSVPTSSQPSVPVMLSSHPRAMRMPSHTMTTTVPPSSQPAVPGKVASHPAAVNLNPTMVRMPTIGLRMPSSRAITMNVGTQFLAVSRANQPMGPRLLIPLSKLNQALMTRKPTQWTAMSKLCQQEVTKLHVEDVGAIVEVGAGQLDDKEKHKNDIVLLDVAQTEHKSASSKQGRTLSLIPTSSSINVTLKSVGSITSNKIFNKKPVPSKQKSPVGLQVEQAKPAFIPKPVNETNAFKTGPALEPMFDQVPQISETLLAQTFQDKNIENTNETGLCVISNVFSLSNVESEGTSEPVMDSGKCDKSDNGKQLGKNVDVNCNSTIHDHNYCEV